MLAIILLLFVGVLLSVCAVALEASLCPVLSTLQGSKRRLVIQPVAHQRHAIPVFSVQVQRAKLAASYDAGYDTGYDAGYSAGMSARFPSTLWIDSVPCLSDILVIVSIMASMQSLVRRHRPQALSANADANVEAANLHAEIAAMALNDLQSACSLMCFKKRVDIRGKTQQSLRPLSVPMSLFQRPALHAVRISLTVRDGCP